MDTNALFHLEYGLYLLSVRGEKDNACIINTVMQITDKPLQICIVVNKANYTHDILLQSKKFNVSVLTKSAPFSVYSDFGYVSGHEKDKFQGRTDVARAKNGIYYLTENANAYLSGQVKQIVELSTHTLFLCEVTETAVLSDEASVTYNYYQKNVKKQILKKDSSQKGYICEVCGYIYEGEELPPDYICPICKHGTEVFRPL